MEVGTPTSIQCLTSNLVYRNYKIWDGERKLLADLISLSIKGYDVILGMDWLAQYHAWLDCKIKLHVFLRPHWAQTHAFSFVFLSRVGL